MRAILPAFLVVACVSGTACASAKIEVQGHRGARGARPENTLPAFQYALDIGVDTLELDAVVTKDDHVVVSHDLDLNPDLCLDANGKRISTRIAIRSLTLAELRRFDCGTLVNPRFKDQTPVPTPRFRPSTKFLSWPRSIPMANAFTSTWKPRSSPIAPVILPHRKRSLLFWSLFSVSIK